MYNPRTDPETVRIQEERALHWLSVGAQPTEAVARIFRTHGTMDRFERLRGGEPLDALVAEANVSAKVEPVRAPVEVVEETEEDLSTSVEDVDLPAEAAEDLEAEESTDVASEETEDPESA